MKLLTFLICGMTLYGCATEAPRIVKYRYVAYSWTGASIDDMISAWGKPNRGYRSASADDPGFARWRVFSRLGSREGSGAGYRYFCDTIAFFGRDGKIAEIDIRHSDSCERYYKDLDSMLRPGVAPPPGAT